MEGVEPTCLAALDPKSSASASFATSAAPEKRESKSRRFNGIFFQLISHYLHSLTSGKQSGIARGISSQRVCLFSGPQIFSLNS